MTDARCTQVDLDATPYYHCISRCVRRAFLCGEDRYSGKSFDHRKGWIVERLRLLSSVFAIDVCAYAVLSNHFHVVLRIDRDRALGWSDDEVVERYGRLFALSKKQLETLDETRRQALVAVWRERLWDLSWMMRSLNEWIARRANREDECRGRFWEGRFKCQPLLDEAALLTCMSYVDLNPVRAGMCERLDEAEFTSIEARLRDADSRMDEAADEHAAAPATPMVPAGLAPFADQVADRDASAIPMDFLSYVELLEWTGRAVRKPNEGSLRGSAPALLQRLGMEPEVWLRAMSLHGLRTATALGQLEHLERLAARKGKRWVKGQRWARRLFAQAA